MMKLRTISIYISLFLVSLFFSAHTTYATFRLGKPAYLYTLSSNLISHWTFDGSDMINGVVQDRSGNNNTGNPINISSSTAYVAGKIGQGMHFDGANDYVRFGRLAATEGASTLTWSFWVYVSRLRTNDVFMSKGSVFSSASWQIAMTSGCTTGWQIIVYIPVTADDGGTLGCAPIPGGGVNAGQWAHYTVVFDGTGSTNADRLKIYMNGTAQSVDFIGTIPATTVVAADVVTLGAGGGLNLQTHSIIDDVRIYSRALTALEVAQLYRFGISKNAATSRHLVTQGLQAHWTFDGSEMTSGVARDRSSNATHGTTTGIATSTFYTSGKIGQALNFDGINDYVSTARTITYPVTGCAWIYPVHQEGSTPEILGSPAFKLRLVRNGADDYSLRLTNDTGTVTTGAGTVALKDWNHVCASVDGSNAAILYINGVSSNSGSISAPGSSGSTNIGMSTGVTTNPFTGKIDDVRIYNRVLAPEEVRQLYFSGK